MKRPSSSAGSIIHIHFLFVHDSCINEGLTPDNLNTHTPGSFYEAFPPKMAKSLWQAGTQVENEPDAYNGQKEITPILGPFAAPAGLCPSLLGSV